MEQCKVGDILDIAHDLVIHTSQGTDDSAPMADHARANAQDALEKLLIECEAMNLTVAPQQISDALEMLRGPPISFETGAMCRSANMIISTIKTEMKARLFFALSPDASKSFYAPQIFGPSEAGRFGEATHEMQESAKCLALERSTASAFHSIRCLEAAIRALSRCLQIPDPTKGSERSWMKLLKALKDRIDLKWPTSTDRMKGDGEFFDNAYAALAAMQNPWRNATMHLDQVYTPEDAKYIFGIVSDFMKRIANRMDEDGKPFA
jgi:hypothetical protein